MADKIAIVLRSFDSFSEAEEFDRSADKKKSGEQRIDAALKLMAPTYEAAPRLKRFLRVVEQEELPVSDSWRVGL